MSETQFPPRPKEPSANLLSTPQPKPTRFKPGLILTLVFGSMILFSAALVYGLFVTPKPHGAASADDTGTANGNTPQFGSFPSGYDQVTANPPAPKVTASPPPLAPTQDHYAGNSSSQGAMQPVSNGQPAQETPAQIAADKAKTSDIFFQGTTDPAIQSQGQAADSGQGAAPAPAAGPLGGALGGAGAQPVSPGEDPSLQSEKNNFVASSQQQGQNDYTNTAEESPISKYEVQAGSIIPAALLTAVDSDLPGDVTAQVTENVYDSPTGNYLLIPQGSRLYGKYDSLISYAQTRALIVWNRIIFPNGKSIDLGGMIGTDATGKSGVQDQVNRHILGLTAALAAATLVSIGPEVALTLGQSSNSSSSTNIYTAPAENLGSNVNNLGQEFVSKELNRPNTITIRAGYPLNVLVNKDIVLTPFSP